MRVLFHPFTQRCSSNFKRLTDQEWEDRFMEGSPPQRPDWVSSYLLNREGKAYPTGRALKGVHLYRDRNSSGE